MTSVIVALSVFPNLNGKVESIDASMRFHNFRVVVWITFCLLEKFAFEKYGFKGARRRLCML